MRYPPDQKGELRDWAVRSFGAGYQAILLAAAAFAALSALLSWMLVRPIDTLPVPLQSSTVASDPMGFVTLSK
jgi:hypothetical protein